MLISFVLQLYSIPFIIFAPDCSLIANFQFPRYYVVIYPSWYQRHDFRTPASQADFHNAQATISHQKAYVLPPISYCRLSVDAWVVDPIAILSFALNVLQVFQCNHL